MTAMYRRELPPSVRDALHTLRRDGETVYVEGPRVYVNGCLQSHREVIEYAADLRALGRGEIRKVNSGILL